jgi:hypothetical protein
MTSAAPQREAPAGRAAGRRVAIPLLVVLADVATMAAC